MAITVSIITGFSIIYAIIYIYIYIYNLFPIILSLLEKHPCIQCMLVGKAALLRKDDWRDLKIKVNTEI